MHLQSLELFGFKSFADKTVFNFHDGVTAIVGPNGCGKSNVLDAVRWVLGEQSAKALRGGEMADVIFNGTDARKPVGFAEVSLTFTDCGHELGVDWHDVRVTRRVYRDGNSEYLLNKTLCRLRDIQSLFADTGVGRSAYSIMEQGKIDMILSSRPEDRRSVFEEAAGITRYKTQKREALRKLEATEANLLRIGDIIKEVKRQIGSLQRQAGKARRYQALMADLQVLDTHHSRTQLDRLEQELAESRAELARLQEAERAAHDNIQKSEDEAAGKRRDLDALDARIGDARAEMQRLQSELSAHRSRIEFNRQRAHELAELIDRYERDIASAEAKRSEQETQIHAADELIERTNRLLETKRTEANRLAERVRELRAARMQQESELQALQLNVSKLESRISALENELGGLVARRDTTTMRIAELDDVISAAANDAQDARDRFAAAQSALHEKQSAVGNLVAQLLAAENEHHTRQRAVADAERDIITAERALVEKRSRVEVLRQLADEGEGLEKGSQAVLKGLDNPERIRPALGGALASLLNVDREFIPALEAAFGCNMHAVVLQNTELANEIIATLTTGKLGHAALAIPGLPHLAADAHPTELPPETISWAFDKVDVPEALAPLVHGILRGVVIVQDLATALRVKRSAPQLAFATLGGEFVSREGVVFGGAGAGQGESLLQRRAVIAQLDVECDQLEVERRALLARRDEEQSRVEAAVAAVAEAREMHQAAHQAHSTGASEMLSFERVLHDAEHKLRTLETEKSTLEQQVANAEERIGELEAKIADQRATFAEQQATHTAAREASDRSRVEEEELTEQLNELRLGVATEQQRHESLVTQREPMAARQAELAELIAARRADIANYQARLEMQTEESARAKESIEHDTVERSGVDETLSALAAERSEKVRVANEFEVELRALRNSLDDLRDARAKQEVRQTQMQLRIENIAEHIARRYHIDLRTFETDSFAFQKTFSVLLKRRIKSADEIATSETVEAGVPPALAPNAADTAASTGSTESNVEELIADLTQQLDNMGPVNLDAVQEYDELEERHRFLETQNNDLTAARKELLDVIARINSTTEKLFADTFAQVRINFREMFAELFGGGRSDLSLLDENDPLECGIEITAKPPGKQLQSVSLLSGGERTMTAVALLFAIYMVRPSPFCILDEMDAPLDESNINRFIRVLERFVQQSQFLIITHNKRTIAKADVLYGVTMEERGVSKLVGMKLAAEKGSDGTLRAEFRNHETQAQFPPERAEQERELALGR
jgi:chromosome segregation protein